MKDELSALLATWKPGGVDPRTIRAQVWQRIEREPEGLARPWLGGVFSLLARPAWAYSLLILGVVAGAAIGVAASETSQMQAYLTSVSPLLMP